MKQNSSPLADIKTDFSQWYNDVVYKSELVDHSPVRGTMIVRPYGYAIWELIKDILDARIKATGHQNAAFPLLIPESFLKREAEHVQGFAPELAVVTHAGGKELEEPLVVRPTSETIIHYMFSKWLHSWRDLPIKINQWANVVRWEMRPRPFLRTTEFFWQEGHTAHETYEEAQEEAFLMLKEYVSLAEQSLAIPVITGRKTDSERFPGADITLTFEAIMQDGKALQMGTSHLLSQRFAHAFDMKFQNRVGKQAYPYLTSWGVTTRLIGAVVMTHGDEKGLVLPPHVAPYQIVIIPILHKDNDAAVLFSYIDRLVKNLLDIRCYVDTREHKTPGAKFYEWELKGVPVRIEVGPRDMEHNQVSITNRLTGEKSTISSDNIGEHISQLLVTVQRDMFVNAQKKQAALWHKAAKLALFGPQLQEHNGLYQTGWCGDAACEQQLKAYSAFSRCLLEQKTFDECFYCTRESKQDLLVAKAY